MKDTISNLRFYNTACVLWEECWNDTDILMNSDLRGKEIARQLIRSSGSIAANIEEGYGRGYEKEYARFLRIARGSARESKGWYQRSGFLLPASIIDVRTTKIDQIIGTLTANLRTIESKKEFSQY